MTTPYVAPDSAGVFVGTVVTSCVAFRPVWPARNVPMDAASADIPFGSPKSSPLVLSCAVTFTVVDANASDANTVGSSKVLKGTKPRRTNDVAPSVTSPESTRLDQRAPLLLSTTVVANSIDVSAARSEGEAT